MVRSIPTALLAGTIWVAFAALSPMLPMPETLSFSGSALAQTTPAKTTTKGEPGAVRRLPSGANNVLAQIRAVDAKARTFTAISKGKEFTFIAPKGKPLPTVGKFYVIRYTEEPGGTLRATTVKSSKSNTSD